MLSLRRVKDSDCWTVFNWANDPNTRANSFSPHRITPQEHVRWFRSRLQDPDCWSWMLEDDGRAVAVVRYERHGGELETSITVAPDARGKGYARTLLEMSARLALEASDVKRCRAFVFTDNAASVKAFERAGFERLGRECWLMERTAT